MLSSQEDLQSNVCLSVVPKTGAAIVQRGKSRAVEGSGGDVGTLHPYGQV